MSGQARIPAGALDRRVLIQQPVITRDGSYGAEQKTWSTLAAVWAQRIEGTQTETAADGVRVSTRISGYRIRYRSDVTPTMRIVEGARVCAITGITEIGRKVGLDIACEEYSV